MSRYTRGLLAVILAVVLVLPAAAFAMLPEANAKSSTGMDGPEIAGKVVDNDTSDHWKSWAGGYDGKEVTTQNVGRIWTDKTVKAVEGGDSDFLTTLSAISSTSDTTISGKPLDIVLVLDASGSMDWAMSPSDSTERIKALKTAANGFIDAIAAQNQSITEAPKQHRVAIVKFAGEKTDKVGNDPYHDGGHAYNYSQIMKNLTPCKGDGAESLKNTVNSISPAGATRADYGLELAEGISSKRADAKKVVVFFTDGSPTSSDKFENKVADRAINRAKSLKANGADIYTIGIFDGANPNAVPTVEGTSRENKFMHAVSSNYPAATSNIFWGNWTINFGARAENANYYKSATSAAELEKIFEDISGSIIQAGYPTEIHDGYGANNSGYITFTDELGDFMQVDNFTSVVYNGTTFDKPTKKTEGNVDTYTFTGDAANLVITVQHAGKDEPQAGDIVTVKIPASLIPLRHFKITDGVLTVDDTVPIQVSYTSSVRKDALNNLFTPEKVTGLKGHIERNTTVADDGAKTVNFYANKWSVGDLGETVATFEPADTNRYYYFQKQTPIYTDKGCTQPAKNSLADDGTYYYKDKFEKQGENGEAKPATTVIEFKGGDAPKLDGAIVVNKDGNLSFSVGTARLAYIDELHTTKEDVGGNLTSTAADVLNPKWNNMTAEAGATHVNSYLGSNGKISYKYDMTPATVDTQADFGLSKVLEGRDWTDEDAFEFGLTSENNAPMPKSATEPVTVSVTNDDPNEVKAAINFGTIEYNAPGTYVYKVSEKNAGTTVDGITYSDNVAEITVTVTPDKKGVLSAEVKVTSGKTEFKNTYTAKPVESSVTDKIAVTKSLTGRDLAAGEFSFELRELKGEDSKLIETVTNDAGGKVKFKAIKYTEVGQHTYKLREVKGNAGGIAYDETVYTIVTTISDNGKGQLVATHELEDAKGVKSIEFKNAYNATAAEASLVGKKNLQVPNGLTPAGITGKFTFTVKGEEGAPMPENAIVHNDADGKVDFGKITFTLDDLNKALGEKPEKPEKREYTFTYTVAESGEVAGVTNDAESSRKVSFTVTDDGKGNLVVSRKPDGNAAFTFTNTYNVTPDEFSVTDQIAATKVLTGRDLKEGEFSFELVEGDEVVATGTNAADGKITMDAVKYTKPGEHKYTLREVNGGTTSKGITYSNAEYTIVTTIRDNGDGTLSATHELGDATAATFENTYHVAPLDAKLDFGLSKAIDGRDWTDADEFSFTITAAEGTPLPDPATVTVSKKDAKDGVAAIKFGNISYTAAGTYKYEIRENAGNAAGMAYDTHVATAVVTVIEDGEGNLTANVTENESGRFTNTYSTELDYAAAGGLKLSKSLSGRPMTEGQFTFTVTPADAAAAEALGLHEGDNVFKSPATAEAAVRLIDILAGHEVKFTQADAGKTFTYTVAEKNDHQPGYTYDDAVRTVTIAIADDGAGTLTATTTVSGGPEGKHTTVHKSGENKVESALVPFHNSYSATTNTPGGTAAQVVATKTLTGRPMVDGEFCFGIAYARETEAINGTTTWNVNGQVSFGTLHYTTKMLADLENAGRARRTDTDAKLTWTINYTAFEYTSPLAAEGVTAATPSFNFKVIVVDNGDGTLTATPAYDGIEPLFENVYGTDAVDAALAGTKKLQASEGLIPAAIAGKFTFTVTSDEAGAPMPERTTATNDAVGNVDFGKIHFTLDDLNRALGVTTDATDKVEADADEAEVDEADADKVATDAGASADESNDESKPAAPTAPRSHTFTYTVTESGSAPGVTNDANATRKVSYTVTDDGAGHLHVVREGDDGAAFTFTNTYSVTPTYSSVTDKVETVKRLTGRDLAADEFTFELLEDGVVVASGTNDANGTVKLNPICYEAPGTHTYTLREACPNALGLYKGVTYDSTTYTVVTTVSDNGDGTLTATHKLEGTTESAGFTNKYHAMPTQVSIGAIKVLEGRELKKDEFSFKLVGEDIESTVTNDADGKINFDKFEYDEPGTYVYTISEVKGDEAGMTYDKSVFTATVNVVDDGEGNLKAGIAYTKDDKSVEGIVFNNTYKKPETPVPTPDPGTPKTVTTIVKTVKSFLPTTGDQQTAALLMAFVIAMAGVGALVWGIRKR